MNASAIQLKISKYMPKKYSLFVLTTLSIILIDNNPKMKLETNTTLTATQLIDIPDINNLKPS